MRAVEGPRLDVSRLGLGCMGHVGHNTGAGRDDAESIPSIHRALERAVAFLDTAEIYGPYTNEELVGRAIAGGAAMLATKFGLGLAPPTATTRPKRWSGSTAERWGRC